MLHGQVQALQEQLGLSTERLTAAAEAALL